MIGSRAWFALMRRNILYRTRHWINTLLELFVPLVFIFVMYSLYSGADWAPVIESPIVPVSFPEEPFIPFSFSDYVTALQSQKVCTRDFDGNFAITGIHKQGKDWPVPFVRCDSRKCQFLGQDAIDFCEFSIIAVAPSVR
jgi:hypothetical protein